MSNFTDLLNNERDLIVVDDFISASQIDTFLQALKQQPQWCSPEVPEEFAHLFEGQEPPKHLFSSQYMHLALGMDEQAYLEKCAGYETIWQKVTEQCGFDLYKTLQNYLQNSFSVSLKTAAAGEQRYCPIVIRDLSTEVLPHADFAPYDAKGWVIDNVVRELAWNIYLTDPIEGGETVVYDKVWHDDDDIDENSYGIQDIGAAVKANFKVKPGRLVFFNSRNYHSVSSSKHERIAVGGLIGETPAGDIIAWG